MDWIDEVTEYAKEMTREQYRDVLNMTDLECKHCGNCCIIPDLKYLDKPPGRRCIHLTKDKLCKIHETKPQPCKEFPYMNRFEWVVNFKLAPPEAAIAFCKIVEDFWVKAYAYFRGGHSTCAVCQMCVTCETGYEGRKW